MRACREHELFIYHFMGLSGFTEKGRRALLVVRMALASSWPWLPPLQKSMLRVRWRGDGGDCRLPQAGTWY